MKKSLIVVLAVLLVVSSIVAGTMALYTTNVDNIGSATVTAKHFYVGASTANNFSNSLVIAPTESVTSTFVVTNKDSSVSAVDIEVVMTLTQTGETLPSNMVVTVKVGDDTIVADGNTYTFVMAKDVEFTKTVSITYFWNSSEANKADNAFIDKAFNYSVKLVGTQKV